jgi:hypothetical protein
MRKVVSTLILLLSGAAAFGQSYTYDRPYGDRDYARQDRSLFDHVRMDLDRASAYPYASRPDRNRFDDARSKLFDFASRFEQGRYEKHRLDDAIDRIQRVVAHNSLDPRDRGALDDDLRRMHDYREFRDHHNERDYDYGFLR